MSDSIQFTNPNLLNPLNTTSSQVPQLPGITKAFPVILKDFPEYFKCAMLNHHMHRTDGKRLAFTHGILETRDHYDIEYLNQEIAAGNIFITKPSPKEIDLYLMKVDPRGTLTKQITPEIEARIKQELEIKLKQELEAKLHTVGISLTPEQLEQFHAPAAGEPAYQEDETKVASIDALTALRAKFTGSVKTDNATLLMAQSAPTLQGISGSDKTVNFAKEAEDRS